MHRSAARLLQLLLVTFLAAGLLVGCAGRTGEAERTTTGGGDDVSSTTGAEEVGEDTSFGRGTSTAPSTASPDRRPGYSESDAEISYVESQLMPVFFGFDKSTLDAKGRAALANNVQVLRRHQGLRVLIEGHCDERGTAEYNLALGDRRARAVRDYLVSSGISSNGLQVVSFGEERPFAIGHDEAAWAQNRRAHFRIFGR
ncbi:MAG: peptidoglycan-associated lipoprotein Pal [Acidobacteriota bacterium]